MQFCLRTESNRFFVVDRRDQKELEKFDMTDGTHLRTADHPPPNNTSVPESANSYVAVSMLPVLAPSGLSFC
jgi:hypothetical protein